MEKRDIFIGGAWPYANYYLHVGHLAALLPGDILARYFRGKGDNVIYVSGSDCHGTPITERAKKENVSPEEIATLYHNEFVKTFNNLGFEYDEYSSTMSEHHIKDVMDQFTKTVTPLFDTIWSNQEQNRKLASLRDILLPKLMSGELNVSNLQL